MCLTAIATRTCTLWTMRHRHTHTASHTCTCTQQLCHSRRQCRLASPHWTIGMLGRRRGMSTAAQQPTPPPPAQTLQCCVGWPRNRCVLAVDAHHGCVVEWNAHCSVAVCVCLCTGPR